MFSRKKECYQQNRILWWIIFCRGKNTIVFKGEKNLKGELGIFLLENISQYVSVVSNPMICSSWFFLMEKEVHNRKHSLTEELRTWRRNGRFLHFHLLLCFQATFFILSDCQEINYSNTPQKCPSKVIFFKFFSRKKYLQCSSVKLFSTYTCKVQAWRLACS